MDPKKEPVKNLKMVTEFTAKKALTWMVKMPRRKVMKLSKRRESVVFLKQDFNGMQSLTLSKKSSMSTSSLACIQLRRMVSSAG